MKKVGKTCDNCGLPDPLFKCGKCGLVDYCDALCQRAHWKTPPGHKTACLRREDRKFVAEVRPTGDTCPVCLAALEGDLLRCRGGHAVHAECGMRLKACAICKCDLLQEKLAYFEALDTRTKDFMRKNIEAKAVGGNVKAQVSLAYMYDAGFFLPKDAAEAAKWYAVSRANFNFSAR